MTDQTSLQPSSSTEPQRWTLIVSRQDPAHARVAPVGGYTARPSQVVEVMPVSEHEEMLQRTAEILDPIIGPAAHLGYQSIVDALADIVASWEANVRLREAGRDLVEAWHDGSGLKGEIERLSVLLYPEDQ